MAEAPKARTLETGELPTAGANEGSTAPHYRRAVGPAMNYDLIGAMQFNLLTALGLREHHYLLDIGCGSLRAGRLFIPYLLPGRYFGIEPNSSLVQAGIANELGSDAVQVKKPTFSDNSSFELSVFGETFDFIVAQSIFSHTSQDQISRCMQEAARVLNPGGLFAATFIEGDEDYEGSGWVYPGRVTYRESTVTSLVTEAGLGMKPLGWANPHRQRWILIGHPLHLETVPDVADPRTLMRELERLTSHPVVRTALRARSLFRSWREQLDESPRSPVAACGSADREAGAILQLHISR